MKHLLLILFMSLCCIRQAYAQYNTNQNKVWAFGYKAGLDFNSGTPVPIHTNMFSVEGCTSVCDKDGGLLFYTDGRTAWDRTHDTMLGADTTLCPRNTFSTTQGTVIVPIPNYIAGTDPTQYYIFSIYGVEYINDTGGMRMYYSKVDMTLNGGLGGIVPGSAGTYLISHMCEKVISIRGNSCDMWVLTHKMEEPVFYAFHVTACGLDPDPVVSVAGEMSGWFAYSWGAMKVSHDGRKIAVFNCTSSTDSASWYGTDYAQTGTELLDFDPVTGIVSNCFRVSRDRADAYGEFSPDGTKLYVIGQAESDSVRLFQYDITDTAAIHASEYEIGPGGFFGDMRLAPDGKIYFSSGITANTLDRIATPDGAGAACGYEPHAIGLLPATYIQAGIPNLYNAPTFTPTDTASTTTDTIVCFETTDTIYMTAPFAGCLRWYDGSNADVHTAAAEGHYTVTSVEGCIAYKHTFNVIAAPTPCTATVAGAADVYAGITIFPQPATDECVLQTSAPFPAASYIVLYDMTGRRITQMPITGLRTTIPLRDMPVGIYQLCIHAGETVLLRKLAVVR